MTTLIPPPILALPLPRWHTCVPSMDNWSRYYAGEEARTQFYAELRALSDAALVDRMAEQKRAVEFLCNSGTHEQWADAVEVRRELELRMIWRFEDRVNEQRRKVQLRRALKKGRMA